MEDNLQILKMEYLSNRLLDHTQILNLSLHDQTIFRKSFKWRRPPVEDNLKILKVEYLSNHLLDPTHILNLTLDYQTILYKSFKWRGPPMEDDLKILKLEYCSNHCMDCDIWVLRGKLEENSEEISSVALLSPACFFFLFLLVILLIAKPISQRRMVDLIFNSFNLPPANPQKPGLQEKFITFINRKLIFSLSKIDILDFWPLKSYPR